MASQALHLLLSIPFKGEYVSEASVRLSLFKKKCHFSSRSGCATWIQETYESSGADRRIGHTVTYDPDKKVLYVYGGSKNKRWFNDVNVLDPQENTWTAVKVCAKDNKTCSK